MIVSPAIEKEFVFRTSRSSGAGGQNVNKVETKVELHFDVWNTFFLNEEQRKIIFEKLKNKINKDGILILSTETERTQFANKKLVVKKIFHLLEKSLKKERKRFPSKPTRASKERRLKKKKIHSERKKLRKTDWEGYR